MRDEERWIEDLTRRQDNTDPIRRIPNVALFEGTLIKGNRRLSKSAARRSNRARDIFLELWLLVPRASHRGSPFVELRWKFSLVLGDLGTFLPLDRMEGGAERSP